MNPDNKIDPKAQAAFEKAMNEDHTMIFKKKELIAIFNILTNVQAKYGDFIVIAPIIDKIQPIVAVDSNIHEPGRHFSDPLTGARKAKA